MQIVTVAFIPSVGRVEAVLTFPDAVTDADLATGNALGRTRIKLQQAVEVAAENAFVAMKDRKEADARAAEARARRASGEKEPPRGPDQIAFAGSKEPAVEVPNTGTVSHVEALRLAGVGGKKPAARRGR